MKVIGTVPLRVVFANLLDQFNKARERIDRLNDSIGNITNAGIKDSLIIKEADVIFDNTVSTAGGGSLSILIFKSGYNYTRKKETTVKYSLINTELPILAQNLTVPIKKKKSDPDALSELIYNAAIQFANLEVNNNKLQKNIELDIAFELDQNANIEISGPIGTVGADVNVSRDFQNTHTVIIGFLLVKTKGSK